MSFSTNPATPDTPDCRGPEQAAPVRRLDDGEQSASGRRRSIDSAGRETVARCQHGVAGRESRRRRHAPAPGRTDHARRTACRTGSRPRRYSLRHINGVNTIRPCSTRCSTSRPWVMDCRSNRRHSASRVSTTAGANRGTGCRPRSSSAMAARRPAMSDARLAQRRPKGNRQIKTPLDRLRSRVSVTEQRNDLELKRSRHPAVRHGGNRDRSASRCRRHASTRSLPLFTRRAHVWRPVRADAALADAVRADPGARRCPDRQGRSGSAIRTDHAQVKTGDLTHTTPILGRDERCAVDGPVHALGTARR